LICVIFCPFGHKEIAIALWLFKGYVYKMLNRRALLCSPLAFCVTSAFAQKKPLVAVSFSLLEDVLKNIAGDAIESFSVIGAAQEVHHYTLRPADLARLNAADWLLMNGLGFEPQFEKLKVKKIIASQRVTPLPNDPHAFQSVANMMLYVDEIAARLPCPHAGVYKEKLAALDAQIKQGFAAIAREKRKIVTSHDAFAYFGKEYGVDFIAPQGKITGEPTAKALASVITQIKREGIKALFVENLTSTKAIETISRETGVKIGGTLYAETLAKSGESSTYLGLMASNAKLMREALA
jgi:zinc/manganese transport system substrate-binding protein